LKPIKGEDALETVEQLRDFLDDHSPAGPGEPPSSAADPVTGPRRRLTRADLAEVRALRETVRGVLERASTDAFGAAALVNDGLRRSHATPALRHDHGRWWTEVTSDTDRCSAHLAATTLSALASVIATLGPTRLGVCAGRAAGPPSWTSRATARSSTAPEPARTAPASPPTGVGTVSAERRIRSRSACRVAASALAASQLCGPPASRCSSSSTSERVKPSCWSGWLFDQAAAFVVPQRLEVHSGLVGQLATAHDPILNPRRQLRSQDQSARASRSAGLISTSMGTAAGRGRRFVGSNRPAPGEAGWCCRSDGTS
jgi:hypothetical protein